MGTAIKHPVSDRVKPSFVIFDIRALWRSVMSVRVAILNELSTCLRSQKALRAAIKTFSACSE